MAYSDKVIDHYENPRNVGSFPKGDNSIGTGMVGAPACVVHDERTTLDRLLPFLFAGVDVREEVRRWGVGGLCAHCSSCIFPNCAFGQG